MTQHVCFLGDVADWIDARLNRVIELRDRALAWADPRGIWTGRNDPYLRGIAGNPIAYVIAAQNFSLTVIQGEVNALRFGDGIRDGGWGYAHDGLRAVSLIGGL